MQNSPRIAHWLRVTTALTSTLGFALALGSSANANPVDGQVAAGDATISAPDAKTVQVDQASQNAVINWQSFNIAPDETTRFAQPNTAAWTLNRVIGSTDPSSILGTLTANGNLAIVNPDGILFGESARVDVGGLIATTHDILDSDFMAGNLAFSQPGNPSASIVNQGNISIADYGLGAFVAPGVRNAGVITAKMGTVSLASGNAFTLDLYGDNLVKLIVGDEIASDVVDAATGKPMDDLVKNEGTISADGGTVALTAATARKAVNSVINNTGVIEAHSVGMSNGKIVLGAQTASTKTAGAPVQTLKVSGNLVVADAPYPAAARPADLGGGMIMVTGEGIQIANADIDASGANGGGTILIGGDYQGGQADDATVASLGIAREPEPIPTASYVLLDENTKLNANALDSGDGGKVIVWSDDATETAATITARGGANGGDGGFIETSGGYLNALKAADASAPNGTAGIWLLDPYDVVVRRAPDQNRFTVVGGFPGGDLTYPTGSPSVVDTAVVEALLNSGTSMLLSTRAHVGGSEHGDITIVDDVHKTTGGFAVVSIESARNITVSPGFDFVSDSGEVQINLVAPDGQITGNNVGQIDLNGGWLQLEGGQGINFHSNYDMPNLWLSSGYLARNVDITFDQDQVKFTHNGSLATIPTNGIQLIDPTATGQLHIEFGSLSEGLQDYAVRVSNQRGWALYTNAAFGALTANGLNRIPEVVSDGSVYTQFSATTPQVNGIYPVWEARATNAPNCYGLTCLPASPYGQSLIDALAKPEEATPPFSIDSKVAKSTPEIAQNTPASNKIAQFGLSIAANKLIDEASAIVSDILVKSIIPRLDVGLVQTGILEDLLRGKLSNKIIDGIKNNGNISNFGKDAISIVMKTALMETIEYGFSVSNFHNEYAKELIRLGTSTAFDIGFTAYLHPEYSACLQCVVVVESGRNVATELVKVGFAAAGLAIDLNSISKEVDSLQSTADNAFKLGKQEQQKGNTERADELFRYALGLNQTAQELKNNSKLGNLFFGI